MLKHRSVSLLCVAAVIALYFAYTQFSAPGWIVLIPLFFWLVITITGSFHMPWEYHLPALVRVDATSPREVAITFDDGPHPEVTPKVLDLLAGHDAKATFFCVGKHAESHPQLIQRMVEQGHTVGDHSYSHSRGFGFKGWEAVRVEMQRTSDVIRAITGKGMKFFRPPFGVTNPSIAKALNISGKTCIGWSVRSFDTTSRSDEQVWKRIRKRVRPGDVILLHDTGERTVEILERLLVFLSSNNLKAVTVDRLFSIEAYE